jgi:hypothetical protein
MCQVMWDIEFLQEALAIKTTCDSHMLRDTYLLVCRKFMSFNYKKNKNVTIVNINIKLKH